MAGGLKTRLQYPEGFGVDVDAAALDALIEDKGVPFIHYRAVPCPVGQVSEDDSRRPHEDHAGCSRGFLYVRSGTASCLFTGNSTQMNQVDVGLLIGSSVMATLPRNYLDSGEPAYFTEFDRLYLPDDAVVVARWQRFQASGTETEKLLFPAVKVTDLLDSQGRSYLQGFHFDVVDGMVRWRGVERPSYDPGLQRGQVCAVRYTYRPYWYVGRMVHEVRVAVGDDGVERLPPAAILQREHAFEGSQDRDPLAPPSPRQAQGPAEPGFGPR